MVKQTEPDQTLIKMPPLRAVKAFVAAARYQNFTRVAEALCVTQAAISRQIRELEVHLGNTSGMTALASNACSSSPLDTTVSAPLSRSVVTMCRGNAASSMR